MTAVRRTWLGGCLWLLAAALLVCVGTLFVEAQTKALRRLFDDAVLDNRNHYLRCDELPTAAEVKRVVEAHQDVIRRIEEAGAGLEYGTCTCCGEADPRADILLFYASRQDRLEIEAIIDGETFFGIPYRLQNR